MAASSFWNFSISDFSGFLQFKLQLQIELTTANRICKIVTCNRAFFLSVVGSKIKYYAEIEMIQHKICWAAASGSLPYYFYQNAEETDEFVFSLIIKLPANTDKQMKF